MRVKIKKEVFVPSNTTVIYKGNEYRFNSDDILFIDIDDNDKTLYVKNPIGSSVSVSLIDVILELFAGDSMITIIRPDYSFEILSNNNCEIFLKENEKEFHFGNIKFKSFCAVSQGANLGNDRFIIKDLDKVRKKHRKMNFFVMSGLPFYILIALLALTISTNLLWVFILIFIIFTIPSIKSRKNFKKSVTQDNVIKTLCDNVTGYRTDENYDIKNMSKSGRFMFKIFEKLFK